MDLDFGIVSEGKELCLTTEEILMKYPVRLRETEVVKLLLAVIMLDTDKPEVKPVRFVKVNGHTSGEATASFILSSLPIGDQLLKKCICSLHLALLGGNIFL